METLPPVHLGAILLTAYTIAWVLRIPVIGWLVETAEAPVQPRRQFLVEISISLLAGIFATTYNSAVLHFPTGSGISLMIGCGVIGFFISLDMALKKERALIRQAARSGHEKPPPNQLYPMSRKFSLVAVTTSIFAAVVMMLVFSRDLIWLSQAGSDPASIARARLSVFYEIIFIMGALVAHIVNLILSYSRNLKLLFDNETVVLERVSQGDFSRTVPVATKDEFGFIAGHTNKMIQGLRHRSKLISALKLAEEVQQSLLPDRPPDLPGLDISGSSRYCDETGGDYYDYFILPENRLAVIVADAADHGVGSALHMSTARAFIRSGIQRHRDPVSLLAEANRFLSYDSRETGRYLTLFYLEIDVDKKYLRWVRAGHDPAFLYDPGENRFHALDGKGMALGIIDKIDLEAVDRHGWATGSILLVGTDGIREARNIAGEMYGDRRIHEVIRNHADESAASMQAAVFESLKAFTADAPLEDDITLVIIKLP